MEAEPQRRWRRLIDSKIIKDIAAAIRSENSKPEPYDTTAEVVRIEDGIAWVHIPGGVDETPADMTINAKEGDQVQVRISGGKAFLTGNATAPPTDDAKAIEARAATEELQTFVASHMQMTNEGLLITNDNNRWKLLVRSDGIDIINPDGNPVAKYGGTILLTPSSGQSFGQLRLTNAGLRLEYTDSENPAVELKMQDTIWEPSMSYSTPGTNIGPGETLKIAIAQEYYYDNMDAEVQRDFAAELYYRTTGDGNDHTVPFMLAKGYKTEDENGVSVEVASQTFDNNGMLQHNIDITNGSGQTINYGRAGLAWSYLYNKESTQGKIGLSHSGTGDCLLVGEGNVTAGPYSALLGYHLIGSNLAQLITGRYNELSEKAFIIGNGYDEDHRSNAFTVDWDGNIEAGGKTMAEIIESNVGYAVRSYSATYTVPANSNINISADTFRISTPEGYEPVAMLRLTTGNAGVVVRSYVSSATGSTSVVSLYNETSSSITATANISILYFSNNLNGGGGGGGGSGGTTDYNELSNKPQIENVELTGNKDFEDLGLEPIDYINFNW